MVSSQHTGLLAALDSRLKIARDNKFAAWTSKYLRDAVQSRGVRIPRLRLEVSAWYEENSLGGLAPGELRALAYAQVRLDTYEDKLAGIVLMQDHLIPTGNLTLEHHLNEMAELFDNSHISDWSTCDWFCVRVLSTLVKADMPNAVPKVLAWHDAENVWRARAALVGVLPAASHVVHHADIARAASILIRRPERFAKTAVGWIMRDVYAADKKALNTFLDANIEHFSPEALNKCAKRMPSAQRKFWLARINSNN